MVEEVFFATGNEGKIKEMRPLFRDRKIELRQVDVDVPEIDAMDVEKVAERKVRDSFEKALSKDLVDEDDLLIVEDTGFYVEGLNGFPGPEAAFFSRTVGVDKLPTLMNSVDDRSAYFKTAIAVKNQNQVKVFTGKLEGKVPEIPEESRMTIFRTTAILSQTVETLRWLRIQCIRMKISIERKQ